MTVSNQQFLNTVVAHLNAQKSQCVNLHGDCLYYHDGKRCALGGAMPEELARKLTSIPNMDARHIHNTAALSLGPNHAVGICREAMMYMPENIQLAQDLQRVHDNWLPEEWSSRINIIATKYNLVVP